MKLTEIISESYEHIKQEITAEILDKPYSSSIVHRNIQNEYRKYIAAIDRTFEFPEALTTESSYYFIAQKNARPLGELITKEDITRFCFDEIILEDPRKTKSTGYFLSALIEAREDYLKNEHINNEYKKNKNTSDRETYTIITRHLNTLLDGLCFNNTANVLIDGDCGNFACKKMQKGTVTINGDCGNYCAIQMRGGTITINGNVHDFVCDGMEDGNVTIFGNAEMAAGMYMSGGILSVTSAKHQLGTGMKGGTIFVNDECGYGIGFNMVGGTIYLVSAQSKKQIIKNISPVHIGGEIYHNTKRLTTTWKRFKQFFERILK